MLLERTLGSESSLESNSAPRVSSQLLRRHAQAEYHFRTPESRRLVELQAGLTEVGLRLGDSGEQSQLPGGRGGGSRPQDRDRKGQKGRL